MMTIVLAEHSDKPIDVLQVVKMVLIHDIVEIDAGDTFIYDSTKNHTNTEEELLAAKRVFGLLPKEQAEEFIAVWSDFAEQQLDDVFEYYLNNANFPVAKKLLVGILNAPQSLVRSPFIGQEEGWLKGREIKYRYLLFKNYKLIYSVDGEGSY